MKPVNLKIQIMAVVVVTAFAQGDLITVGVEGVVQHSNLQGVSGGSTMTGYCVYDTARLDTVPEAYRGTYELETLVMTVGDYRFEYRTGAAEKAWFSVWATDVTYLAETSRGIMLRDGQSIGEPTLGLKLIDLCNASSSATDAFPVGFPDDIGFFSWRNEWHVVDGLNELVSGELTAIEIIPEPTSLSLLLLGAICLRKRR